MIDDFADMFGTLFGGSSSRRKGKKCKNCGKIWFVAIIGTIVGIYYLHQYMAPKVRTEQRVEHHARLLCHPPKDGFRKGLDGWGIPMRYATEEIEDPFATKCTVTSAGRDGEFDTGDDLVAVNHNYHKAKIVGDWAGNKLKDGAKGLWNAITN